MPVPEVVVLYTVQTYNELRDRMFKWFFVPYPQARAGIQEAERYFKNEGARAGDCAPGWTAPAGHRGRQLRLGEKRSQHRHAAGHRGPADLRGRA